MEPLDLFARREIISVSELVGRLKRLAEEEFDYIWVRGEISGHRRPASGHHYFTLKDADAGIKAVLFRHQASLLRFRPEDGLGVICSGRVSVYEPRGEVQLVVETMEPVGAGSLAVAFEQIKKRLAAQGLFDDERKRPLPDLPQRVAVITSPSGAAIRDFLHVLHRRFDRIEVAIYPVQVQGEAAPKQMIQALRHLAQWGWPEVIVLTRGGGSPEDLWAFNDEALARAIAASPIPVVSAVGHEIDVTISDLVADYRAPTPSAAAEILVGERAALARRLAGLGRRLEQAGARIISRRRQALAGLTRVLGDPRRRLADRRLRIDDLAMRAAAAIRQGLGQDQRRLGDLSRRLLARRPDRVVALLQARRRELGLRLANTGAAAVLERRGRLERDRARLGALSPLAVLGRGYALVRGQAGGLVKDAALVREGESVDVRLQKGSLRAKVEEVLP